MRRRAITGPARAGSCAIVLAMLLSGCGKYEGYYPQGVEKGEPNLPPQNWRADTLAFLKSWLNDPAGVRDAAIAEPELKSIGGTQRYAVCVRFNARKTGGGYEGTKDRVIIFTGGRLDTVVEARKEDCADARFQPFPELERLKR